MKFLKGLGECLAVIAGMIGLFAVAIFMLYCTAAFNTLTAEGDWTQDPTYQEFIDSYE